MITSLICNNNYCMKLSYEAIILHNVYSVLQHVTLHCVK